MAKALISTKADYDAYLQNTKGNRIKRIGEFINPSTCILHECQDLTCKRVWKPKPSQMLEDDYYCPSCVLHHRNNMDRFSIASLVWTKSVPNTFYVFSIVDPLYPNKKLIKFGRTQNKDAKKRYPTNELKSYKMKLLCELRGRLITTTRIENYWKKNALELDIYHTFSVATFHGKSECIDIGTHLEEFMEETRRIFVEDNDDPTV